MPSPGGKAAFRYLTKPLRRETRKANGEPDKKELPSAYGFFLKKHAERIDKEESFNISSYDLFANMDLRGIECAMFPWLYPRSEFSDTR